MLEKTLNRIMDGAKTPEGKIIAILLTLSLALMTWNATSIKAAFAQDGEDLPAASDVMADETDVAAEQEAVQEAPAAPEAPAAVEAAEPATEEATGSEVAVEPEAEEGDASQQATEPAGDEASKEAAPAEKEGDKEKAEETAYPAVTFDAKYTGDAAIAVSAAEGVFPEGANVEFGSVDSDSVYAAVDAATDDELAGVQPVKLVFRDADGKEIAPKGQVTVKVSWATPLEGNAHVFTISDSGAAEAVSGSNLVSATPEKQEFKLSAEQAMRAFAIAATTAETENATNNAETTEEKAEIQDAEIAAAEYPEQTIYGHTGWTSVKIKAPKGSLPEGAQVVVNKVETAAVADVVEAAAEAQGKSVGDMVALDVTITDKDGNEIQPLLPVQVEFVNVGISGDDISVYHIADSGVATEVATETAADVVQSFEAEGFSIYVVTETGEVARATVNFYNGGTLIQKMYVKDNDAAEEIEQIVYDPGAGELGTNQVFKGWTLNSNYSVETLDTDGAETGDEVLTIADVRSYLEALDIPDGGTTVNVYALIYNAYTVTYIGKVDESGQEVQGSLGSVTTLTVPSVMSTQYTVNMSYTPSSNLENFEGWLVNEGGSNIEGHTDGKLYPNGTEITISGDVTFGVSSPAGHWLVFHENGKNATYNAPQFVKDGEVTKPLSKNPERPGYTFADWYTGAPDTEGGDPTGNAFTFGGALTGDGSTHIYAKWTMNPTANYTVIIWKQSVSGTDSGGNKVYDYVKSIPLTGNSNSTVDTISVNSDNTRVTITGDSSYSYEGFSVGGYDQNVTIDPAGNTVVNVYFDRNEYTLTFTTGESTPGTITYVYYGWTYSDAYIGDAVTNQSHIDEFENSKKTIGGYEISRRGNNNNRSYAIKLDGTWYSITNGYYVWNASNITAVTPASDGTVQTITALYGQNIASYFPITGEGVSEGSRWDPGDNSLGWNQVMVFIDTMPNESVSFTLDDGAGRPTKTMYYYVEALPDSTNTVTRNGVKYVLYTDPIEAKYYGVSTEDYATLSGFTKKEVARSVNGPAIEADSDGFYVHDYYNDESVYFFYKRDLYQVLYLDGSYFDGNGNLVEGMEAGQQGELGKTGETIPFGADISSYETFLTPKYTNYTFAGWYVDKECTTPYAFGTMPEGGVKVYAKWILNQYRVFLHPNVPTNDTTLNWGSSGQKMNFRVSAGETVSTPKGTRTGWEMVGWYLDPEFTTVFNAEDYILNDDSVTTPYNKTTDLTDPDDDKYGQNYTSNSDITGYNGGDRFWITRKFDVYAQWRQTIEGARASASRMTKLEDPVPEATPTCILTGPGRLRQVRRPRHLIQQTALLRPSGTGLCSSGMAKHTWTPASRFSRAIPSRS